MERSGMATRTRSATTSCLRRSRACRIIRDWRSGGAPGVGADPRGVGADAVGALEEGALEGGRARLAGGLLRLTEGVGVAPAGAAAEAALVAGLAGGGGGDADAYRQHLANLRAEQAASDAA